MNTQNAVVDLRQYPVVMQKQAAERVSGRYGHINTFDVANVLRDAGWLPTKVQVNKALAYDGYQRHMVRFRQASALGQRAVVGAQVVELVLVNAHNGRSSYQFYGGLWRFTCANGAMVSESLVGKVVIPHLQYDDDRVIEASQMLIERTPLIMNAVKQWENIKLNKAEQLVYAKAAVSARYDQHQLAHYDIKPEDVLTEERPEDVGPDLWRTYNRAQEHLIKGGRFLMRNTPRANAKVVNKAHMSQPVVSVKEDVRINRNLWAMSAKMAEVKKAGGTQSLDELYGHLVGVYEGEEVSGADLN